jgi:hypothetical protein
MANKAFAATSLVGGGVGALDSIDGASLSGGDLCFIVTSAAKYDYYLSAASGAAESSPYIISPDTNAGTKRWLLVKLISQNVDIVSSAIATLTSFGVGDGTDVTLQKRVDVATGYYWYELTRDGTHGTEANDILIGYNGAGGDVPWLRGDNSAGAWISYKDLKLGASGGTIQDNNAAPAGTRPLGYNGYFYATRSYAPVYADYAERYELAPNVLIEYGKCYKIELDGKVRLTNKMPDKGLVGIASDTFGMCIGGDEHRTGETPRWVEIAMAGRVLGCVDKIYEPGTILTGGEGGILTAMTPGKGEPVAKYLYPEKNKSWGPEGNKISVSGRHWVKVI